MATVQVAELWSIKVGPNGRIPQVVLDIGKQAVRQYAAGLLVEYQLCALAEMSITVQPGAGSSPAKLVFRLIYQIQLPGSMGREFWMVVLQALDPRADRFDPAAAQLSAAQVYVLNPQGWTHTIVYEHQWTHHRPGDYTASLDDGQLFPEAPPDPLR